MRKLLYRLSNGTIVNTMADAKASGLEYTLVFEGDVERHSPLTEKQRANLKAVR